jgi:hypothetical protein
MLRAFTLGDLGRKHGAIDAIDRLTQDLRESGSTRIAAPTCSSDDD